jgi:preprotein translocase subunit YajC
MEYLLVAVLLLSLVGTYFLMNIRASKKQTDRKNRIKWRF